MVMSVSRHHGGVYDGSASCIATELMSTLHTGQGIVSFMMFSADLSVAHDDEHIYIMCGW